MKLVFVRHAETLANAEGRMQGHADFGLSPLGVSQAEKLQERFERESFQPTHVYSSPLGRSSRTAEILSRSWTASVTYWDDLKEHDIGILTGMTWEEIAEKYPHVDQELEKSRQISGVEGAESLLERRARSKRVIERILERHDNDDIVLIVSHGGILQHILAALMGTDRIWGMSIRNTGVFEFTLDLDRWSAEADERSNTFNWRINRFNDASHLALPQPPTSVLRTPR